MLLAFVKRFIWRIRERAKLEREAAEASTYEEWHDAQVALDNVNGSERWTQATRSDLPRAVQLREYIDNLRELRLSDQVRSLANNLRLVKRGLYDILEPVLYRHSYVQTKELVHEYLDELKASLCRVAAPVHASVYQQHLSPKEKLEFFSHMQRILGQTTLVLQGGAGASLCHIGVVKALCKRGLLPRIITGTGTGALIAAVVATTPDAQLMQKLQGEAVNLSAFDTIKARHKREQHSYLSRIVAAWQRRWRRFRKTGHVFEIEVIQRCAQDNVGDLTFAEAFELTGRVLNITVPVPLLPGQPQLLNHVTASQVLIRSAISISVATSRKLYAPARLLMRDESGQVVEYRAPDYTSMATFRGASRSPEFPLGRLGEMFNVNNFIFSQTQPYIAPFESFYQDVYRFSWFLGGWVRLIYKQVTGVLKRFGILGFRPDWLHRAFRDEMTFSSLKRPKLVIPIRLTWEDWLSIYNPPTPQMIAHLADFGERNAWPYIHQIEVRTNIEYHIAKLYQQLGGEVMDF